MSRFNQRGSGSVLIVSVVLILLLVAFIGITEFRVLASIRSGRNISDTVALAAAQGQKLGLEACLVAEQTAWANDADLVSCEVETGYGEFIVSVTVHTKLKLHLPGVPGELKASSKAGYLAES